jgi:O-antigen/teichoic acid export membrane protein
MPTSSAGAPRLRADARVAKGFVKLGGGEALARVIGFGATAYLARRLGADAYGVIVLALAVMTYVGRLSDLGLDLLGVHDVADDRDQLPTLIPRYLGARLLVATFLIATIVVAGLLVMPQPEGAVLASMCFVLAPIALGTKWVHLGLEQPGMAAAARSAQEVLASLLIVAAVNGPADLARVPVAQIIGEGVGAYILLRAVPRTRISLREMLSVEVVRTLYRRSWPLVLSSLLGLVIFNSDFFFLRFFRDSATVGTYATAYLLIGFCVNLGHSYSMSLLPAITRLKGDPGAELKLYHNALAQVFAGSFPVAVGGCLVASQLIPVVFGRQYAAAAAPLQILIWSIPIAFTRYVAQSVMVAHERQKRMLAHAATAATTNVALNLTLIPIWGMRGAAAVTVLTEAVRLVPMLRDLQRNGLPMAPPARFARAAAAGGIMALTLALCGFSNLWLAVATGVVVYPVALYFLGGIRLRSATSPELSV